MLVCISNSCRSRHTIQFLGLISTGIQGFVCSHNSQAAPGLAVVSSGCKEAIVCPSSCCRQLLPVLMSWRQGAMLIGSPLKRQAHEWRSAAPAACTTVVFGPTPCAGSTDTYRPCPHLNGFVSENNTTKWPAPPEVALRTMQLPRSIAPYSEAIIITTVFRYYKPFKVMGAK